MREENKTVCYRCGYCCKNFIATVPKTEESDLSPEFIDKYAETHSYGELEQYIQENSQPMGEVCPWLEETPDGCRCKVYEHRSSECRDYPGRDCNIGKHKIGKVKKE